MDILVLLINILILCSNVTCEEDSSTPNPDNSTTANTTTTNATITFPSCESTSEEPGLPAKTDSPCTTKCASGTGLECRNGKCECPVYIVILKGLDERKVTDKDRAIVVW